MRDVMPNGGGPCVNCYLIIGWRYAHVTTAGVVSIVSRRTPHAT